jgi:hypothetical protein
VEGAGQPDALIVCQVALLGLRPVADGVPHRRADQAPAPFVLEHDQDAVQHRPVVAR